ncbi:hypothetical protein [Nocardioides zeae]|uniref:ABC-type glycerol-3-phosphate transport system substrate-binding protein n=1 Tax=Nocardioides zeae TaxID=1457234 RepID=A0AAJ1U2V5_9ACTN|nr:hypothetical protein [Nocardioides zeae]MDQ1106580.1 ABC-type glycerol-3-phosphate transport system substrate-binding protein [Nocardioides zeae]
MHRTAAALLLSLAAVTLTACGGDDEDGTSTGTGTTTDPQDGGDRGGDTCCEAVEADTASAAVAYNPVLPGMNVDIDGILDFLETAGAPDGLEAEHETWVAYLEDKDPEEFAPEPDDVAEAREALFDAQLECR